MTYNEAARTDIGFMMVDWQQRIDFDRMRRERLAKVREAMQKEKVDVLTCWRWENYRYLTSIRTHEWPTMFFIWSAAMTSQGDPFIWSMDKESNLHCLPFLDPDHIKGELRTVESELPAKLWCEEVKEICKKDGVKPRRIAIDALTVPLMHEMMKAFPDAEIVDSMNVFMQARQIKTVDEIRCLVAAYMLTAAGMEKARSLLKVPGMRECELLGEAYRVMYAHGNEWVQCSNIVTSGDYLVPYKRFTSDRIIQPRDLVVIDIGGRFNGYYADFTRTFLAGEDVKATPQQRECYQRVYDALRRVQKAAKPGNTTADLFKAAGEDFIKAGVLGHGLGIGPAEPPVIDRICLEKLVTLEPGMVFAIEPWAQIGRDGVRLEENLIITEDGCELLSKFPHDPRLCDEKPISEY
jgi:Xaa-Pro aminopeptidase